MRSGFRKKLDDFYAYMENTYRAKARIRAVKKTLAGIDGGNKKNDDKYDEYLDYWKKFGQKPSKIWLRLYAKDGEDFNPRYIPDNLWFGKILPYYNNMTFRRPYEDKNFHDRLFSYLHRPNTVYKCIAGIFYNKDNQIITEEEAIEILLKLNRAIIKPSIDSGMGRLIQFYEKDTDTRKSLKEKLKLVGQNYIVQEIVDQHQKLADLNPNTLNTVRIISFLFEGDVHILSCILRMGSGDAKVDNVSAGGLQVTLENDGSLHKYASDKLRNKHSKHPDSNIVFDGYKVPSFDKIVESVKEAHRLQAHFKIIGWDFALDKLGNPIFIEYNVMPGANQMTGGPTFGDLTEKVLEDVFITRKFENAQN